MSFASHRGRNASFSSVTEAFPLLRAQEQEAEKAAGGGGADKQEKLWALMASYLASDVHSIQRSIANHVEYTLAGSRFNFDQFRAYVATAHR
jgi:starch phosphorylase